MRIIYKKILIIVMTIAMICPIMSNVIVNNYMANYASALEEKAQYRIMPLGDSITAGYCPGSKYQFGGYRMYLANMLEENGYSGQFDFVGKWNTGEGYDMDNNGTNGVMIASDDWGDSIKTDIVKNGILDKYQPDMILLQIGTNDILEQDENIELREISKINERLEDLINTVIANANEDTVVFLASIPYMEGSRYEQYNDNVTDYNLFIRQLVKSEQTQNQSIYFVDINGAVSEGQYVDGVHPNQEGYSQMGTLWYETIMSYLYDRESFLEKQEELLYIPEPTEPSSDPASSNPSNSSDNPTQPTSAPTTAKPAPATTAPTTVEPKATTANNKAVQAAKDKSAAEKVMKQAKITKLTAKAKGKKKIVVSWKKVSKAKGYNVQVSNKKNFKNILVDKTTSKVKLTIKSNKIKSKKTYYVRVRAYATYKDANGSTQKVYSSWIKKVRKVKAK